MITLGLRRSIGRTAFAAIVSLVIFNYFLRPLDSLHEMQWAIYNFHFVTVLLAPLVAGLGAWEGVRFSATKEAVDARNEARRAVTAIWASLMTWTSLAYLVGLTSVVIAVKLHGTPGHPYGTALQTTPPALALVGFACASGLVVGWKTEKWISVAMMPLVVFAMILFGYSVDYAFVRVGGAGASLISLSPRQPVSAVQFSFYAAATIAALGLSPRIPGMLSRGVFASIGVVIAAAILLAGTEDTLEVVRADVACEGDRPEVCLTVEYERYRPDLIAALDPLVAAIKASGHPAPVRLTQDLSDVGPLVGFIPQVRDTAEDPRLVATGAVINSYIHDCLSGDPDDPAQLEIVGSIVRWVDEIYDYAHGIREEPPPLLAAASRTLIDCATST